MSIVRKLSKHGASKVVQQLDAHPVEKAIKLGHVWRASSNVDSDYANFKGRAILSWTKSYYVTTSKLMRAIYEAPRLSEPDNMNKSTSFAA